MKFKQLPVSELEKLLHETDPLILDCRKVSDYKAGHLANALHVHEGLTESLARRGDKQRSVLIYCYHGHASEHLAEFFTDFGFKAVYSLVGGYAEYSQYIAHSNSPA